MVHSLISKDGFSQDWIRSSILAISLSIILLKITIGKKWELRSKLYIYMKMENPRGYIREDGVYTKWLKKCMGEVCVHAYDIMYVG